MGLELGKAPGNQEGPPSEPPPPPSTYLGGAGEIQQPKNLLLFLDASLFTLSLSLKKYFDPLRLSLLASFWTHLILLVLPTKQAWVHWL